MDGLFDLLGNVADNAADLASGLDANPSVSWLDGLVSGLRTITVTIEVDDDDRGGRGW